MCASLFSIRARFCRCLPCSQGRAGLIRGGGKGRPHPELVASPNQYKEKLLTEVLTTAPR